LLPNWKAITLKLFSVSNTEPNIKMAAVGIKFGHSEGQRNILGVASITERITTIEYKLSGTVRSAGNFSLHHRVQTGSGAHTVS
jgi:hypothetical protein